MSADDVEDFEAEAELLLYREYRDVVGLFRYVVETERRLYLANDVRLTPRQADGDVFFEILLIASYGLMIHGGGAMRLRAGVQYIAYNLVGSVLFLAALGVLYAVTGTLNMADMAARVAAMPAQDTALLRTGAVLLMLVFAIKAALVPLHFWLPSTYADAPGPVAALFAIMTKVGIYAIIRFFTLVFPHGGTTGQVVAELLLLVVAVVAAAFTITSSEYSPTRA